MARSIRLLDIVALLVDRPDRQLQRGQVGTVVEALAPDVWEVEFSDDRGQAYACLSVPASDLLVLVHQATARSR